MTTNTAAIETPAAEVRVLTVGSREGTPAERNALVRRAWKELDGLSRLAAARKAGQP